MIDQLFEDLSTGLEKKPAATYGTFVVLLIVLAGFLQAPGAGIAICLLGLITTISILGRFKLIGSNVKYDTDANYSESTDIIFYFTIVILCLFGGHPIVAILYALEGALDVSHRQASAKEGWTLTREEYISNIVDDIKKKHETNS